MLDRMQNIQDFITESLDYFNSKFEKTSMDKYFADRDTRSILDKTLNDIILSVIDISIESLKYHKRNIPKSYKDTVLACYEFVGDVALKVAPLVKRRNETIHQYLKINWQNVVTVHNNLGDIKEFAISVCREREQKQVQSTEQTENIKPHHHH